MNMNIDKEERGLSMPQQRTINIHVLPNDTADGRAGSFLAPPPFVKVDVGDTINFIVSPGGSTFRVVFVGLSPFPVNEINEATPANNRVATYAGRYHYQVSVTTSAGNTYRITNCPEMEV